eukprot:GHVO01009452.1.p1 GENE.GHVO01009452.1~~GHVO01009452.1.p1  ORF type:complete len:372 (-),score=72.12 GHVO01009452.1:167-1282(-)
MNVIRQGAKQYGIADAERQPLSFKDKVILAPLTTVGNLPFRRLCIRQGVDVTVSEMALASSVLKKLPAELSLLRRHPEEKIFGIQIAGSTDDILSRCCQFLRQKTSVDFVDLNAACPLQSLHDHHGAGAVMMRRPQRLQGVVKTMREALGPVPLTVKLRMSYSDKCEMNQTAAAIIPTLKELGCRAVALHGRTSTQRYSKTADWDYIQKCAAENSSDSFDVIGNGDLLDFESVYRHDRPLMIGRGALIKPWIFTEIKEKRNWDISASERLDLMKAFVDFGLDHWGSDGVGVETTRRFFLEWMSFTCRYVPVGLLERPIIRINARSPRYCGRSDLETLLASSRSDDWIKISEMFLGKVADGFTFMPKHRGNS